MVPKVYKLFPEFLKKRRRRLNHELAKVIDDIACDRDTAKAEKLRKCRRMFCDLYEVEIPDLNFYDYCSNMIIEACSKEDRVRATKEVLVIAGIVYGYYNRIYVDPKLKHCEAMWLEEKKNDAGKTSDKTSDKR